MEAKPVIGLIGGIGSGKSQVAAALAAHGGHVIRADQLGHEALRQPEVRDRVVRRWGPGLLDADGQIVRRKLGAIVFADPAQRRELEEVVFPWIGRAIRAEVARAQADPQIRFIVLDAAVMVEAGWHTVCDKIIFVDAPPDVRLRRVAARGWTAADLQAREKAQLPLTQKAIHADHSLENSGSLEQLHRQVEGLLRLWGLAPVPAHSLEPANRGGPVPGPAGVANLEDSPSTCVTNLPLAPPGRDTL
jgi:dephospho-CoA kinase